MDEPRDKVIQQSHEPKDSSDFVHWLSSDSHSIDRSHPHATILQCLSARAVHVQAHVKLPVFAGAAQLACWTILGCMDAVRVAQVQCARKLNTLRCNLLRRNIVSPHSGKAAALPHHGKFIIPG